MIKGGVIEGSIKYLQQEPKMLQIWYDLHGGTVFAQGNLVDNNWEEAGFSFCPAVWRMSDYYLLEGGFTGVTRDVSKGRGAGVA